MEWMHAQRSAADLIHRLSKNQFDLNNKFYEPGWRMAMI